MSNWNIIGVTCVLIFQLVSSISPTSSPTFNTPKCPLSAHITCSVKATGGNCSQVYVPYSDQCNTGTIISYEFTYCNLNPFTVKLKETKSVIRSDFADYTFETLTIPSSSCISQTFDGLLKHCNVTSQAFLMLTGASPKGDRCFVFTQSTVIPIFLNPTKRPSRKPSRKPSMRPIARPSKRPSRYPTRKPSHPIYVPTVNPRSKQPSKQPSHRPTTVSIVCNLHPSIRQERIISQISIAHFNLDSISNTSSPQAEALSWLVNYDGLQLCPGDPRILQRYIMAVFYFSTYGDSTWVMCGRYSTNVCHSNITWIQGDPIIARYGHYSWLSAVDECLWGGLACNNATGMLDRIELKYNRLGGTLPSEITQLKFLRFLILQNCCSPSIPIYNAPGYIGISGNLPENIGSLESLLIFQLFTTLIQLPPSIYNISNLKEINVAFNRFHGWLPTPLAGKQLMKLKYLQLAYNSFSGSIPNLSASTKLSTYTIHGNHFTGLIPRGMCNVSINNLWADCTNDVPVICSCCTRCF